MTESLQEIERLVANYGEACINHPHNIKGVNYAALLSAITRVVKRLELVEGDLKNSHANRHAACNDIDKRDTRIAVLEKALWDIPCSCHFVSEKADRSNATSVVCARCAALSTAEG